MDEEELRNILRLVAIRGIGSIRARMLVEAYGSATRLMHEDAKVLRSGSAVCQMVAEGRDAKALQQKVDAEMRFIESHHIRPLLYGQPGYPHRLAECPDAPALLFQLGNTDLESRHVVSIVGTRVCTQYGRDMVNGFVRDLKALVPDLLVVSGLALGIDVSAHHAALEYGVPTVGVLAHGLDRIYPAPHRNVAKAMLEHGGGLLTEYMSGTEPERGNFLSRNRIIAGLSDAVIVAESKDKGGSLVTASIAIDYNRDVFAFPGRVGDDRSKGCNRLIRLNRAGLITCADDFVEAMNWNVSHRPVNTIQHSIPFEEEKLSPRARLVLDALRDRGDLLLSQIADVTGLDHAALYEELLDLEMDGKIRSTPGGLYQLR